MMTADTKAVLLADAMMFLVALLLEVWKYNQIATSGGGTRTPDTRIMIRPEGSCGVSLDRLDWLCC